MLSYKWLQEEGVAFAAVWAGGIVRSAGMPTTNLGWFS